MRGRLPSDSPLRLALYKGSPTVSHDSGVTPNVSYTYSAPGLRAGMTDGSGTSSYTYDSLGRPVSVQDGLGQTVGYSYDVLNNLTGLTYPGSKTVTYGYNAGDEMVSARDWLSNTTSFGYDLDGRLISQIGGNGVHLDVALDAAGQVLTMTHGLVGSSAFLTFNYSYDGTGLLKTALQGGPQRKYSYDGQDRLTADVPAISLGSGDVTQGWGYDAATQLTTTSYKIGGNPATTGARAYDAANQLASLVEMNNGVTTKYLKFVFDAKGNRTTRTDTLAGTAITYAYNQADELINYNGTTTYTYNGDGQRMTRAGSSSDHFLWNGGLLLADSTASYIYGPSGILVEQVQGTTPYYYHADRLGSVRALTDSSGAVVATAAYDAYGNKTAGIGTVYNPFGYAGEYTDAESGLIYLRARYYDPATQQFLTVDPALAMTEQAYAYAAGSPTNFTDPSGLFIDTLLDAGFLALDAADIACHGLNWENGISTGADLVGLALPFVTGLGPASHIIFHAVEVGRDLEKAAETERAAQHAEDAVRHASDEASHLCSFSADTAVTTPDGLRPISSLKVGDLVLAYNQQTGTTGYYPVTALLVHNDPTLVTLTIDGATIVTTPEHPFYTADGRWTPAGDLRVGSRVREANGSYGVVQSIILVQHPKVMYNLTVEGAHTFFVGTARVLVHNSCLSGPNISIDDAIDQAVNHVGPNGTMGATKGGNYQFISKGTNAAGQEETRIARIDVNPADPHVQRMAPHLNIETHTKVGRKTIERNTHIPIDPQTIRPGDHI